MSLQGKCAVVTGGSRGIGRAVCLELADQGADLLLNYAGNREAAEETAALCREKGVRAEIQQGDVSRAEDCSALFGQAAELYGRVDILVNNAGITRDTLLLRMSEEDFDRVLEVNLRGAFLCMKQAARLMVRQRSGRIVNMSSVVGLRGNAGQVNYAASKAGLIGMTKSLARELAGRGVTVNAVAPGFIATDMTAALSEEAAKAINQSIPQGRMGTPEDVAEAVLFLSSEQAGYITGQVLCVDGGMAM